MKIFLLVNPTLLLFSGAKFIAFVVNIYFDRLCRGTRVHSDGRKRDNTMNKFTRFTPTTLNEDQLYSGFDSYGMDSSRAKTKKDKTGSEKKNGKDGTKSSTIKNETMSGPSASRKKVDNNDKGKYDDKLPREKTRKKRKVMRAMTFDEAEEDNGHNYDNDNESNQEESERNNDSKTEEDEEEEETEEQEEEEEEEEEKKKMKMKKNVVNSNEEDDDDEETATKSHGSRRTYEQTMALHKSSNSSKDARKRDRSRDRRNDSIDRYSNGKKIRSGGGGSAPSRERDPGDNNRRVKPTNTTQSRKPHRAEDDTLINNEKVSDLMETLWFSNKDTLNDQTARKSQSDHRKFIGEAPAFSIGSTIDISTRQSTYALLARFNIKKILREFGLDEEMTPKQCKDVTQIVFEIHRSLWRLGNFAKRYNIAINFPEQSLEELAAQFEEGQTITDEDRRESSPEEDQILDNDPNKEEKRNTRLYGLIGTLDRYVRVFLICAAMRRQTDYRMRLQKSVEFSALNFIYNDEHNDYLIDKIFFQNYDDANDRYRLGGYFLISIKLSDRKLRYPTFIERENHLVSVVRDYIRGPLFKRKVPNDVKIYVNVAMKQECGDFNICDPLPTAELKMLNVGKDLKVKSPNKTPAHVDPSGVLALVEIAFAKLDVEKKCISVKAYIVSTYSSVGAAKQ